MRDASSVELEGEVMEKVLAFHARVWRARVDKARSINNNNIELCMKGTGWSMRPTGGLTTKALTKTTKRQDGDCSATQCIYFTAVAPTPASTVRKELRS